MESESLRRKRQRGGDREKEREEEGRKITGNEEKCVRQRTSGRPPKQSISPGVCNVSPKTLKVMRPIPHKKVEV